MSKKRSSSEPRTEPRTEPTITPVRLEWEDKLPLTGADELVEEGGAEDEVEVGTFVMVVGGEGRVRVDGVAVEGTAEVEDGVARVEEGVARVEEGVAGVGDVRDETELVGEEVDDDGVGEVNPP